METQRQFDQWSSPDRGQNQNQSRWLQTTLSDLDMRMKTMIKLIGENADCRAECYGKGRSELVQMLEEFDKSYRSLAEEHDQLRSKLIHIPAPGISSSCNLKRGKDIISNQILETSYYDPESEVVDSHPESVVEDPESEFDSTNLDHVYLDKIADEMNSSEMSNKYFNKEFRTINFPTGDDTIMKINDLESGQSQTTLADFQMDISERENTWSELKFQVTKLMEENLQQQAELLRRNAKKRETIKELRSQLESMKTENMALQSCLRWPKVDAKRNQSQISRLKGQFSLRFLGCSS